MKRRYATAGRSDGGDVIDVVGVPRPGAERHRPTGGRRLRATDVVDGAEFGTQRPGRPLRGRLQRRQRYAQFAESPQQRHEAVPNSSIGQTD